MHRHLCRSAVIGLALALAGGAQAEGGKGVPLMQPPLRAKAPGPAATGATPPGATGTSAPRLLGWNDLVPAGWDPFKAYKALDLGSLNDGDPRAGELLAQMRKAWDQAPVNPALAGQTVRIPGFVVPLEEGRNGTSEFLLVPYFGACVHSPPPPSNQIIHVLPRSPVKGLRSMDTVWITGVLSTVQTDTDMGMSSWRLDASSVAPYTEAARP